MRETVLSLPWLADAPADFSVRCRSLALDDERLGDAVRQLATYRLDAAQSTRLGRAIGRLRAAGCALAPLSAFRLGVLASATFDLAADCIPAAAARHGVAVELVPAPYDQVMQQALDPASDVNLARADAVLVAVDHRWLGLARAQWTDPGGATAQALERLGAVVDNLRRHGEAAAILQTVAQPPHTLFGSHDRQWSGSVRAMIDETNRGIAALAQATGSYLLDVAAVAERVGTDLWFDPVHWASYKLPFSAECCVLYAETLGRLLGAMRGTTRKCLVLDLDNTIWGGAIGDDEIEGIVLGPGSAAGEAFLAVQQHALELRRRGILLAVCSRNDEEIARQAFREHPEMVLRQEHIAAFRANWSDKPANLEAIAKQLGIGPDALVIVDDNPAERARIRAALPMVAVPELPADPGRFVWYLDAAGYFESVGHTAEDATRAESYAADAGRDEALRRAHGLDEYLSSLDMVLGFAPFDAASRPRIVQLINKTNQFNLTTRRHTSAQVLAMEERDDVFTLQVRLADRFGDLGVIAAAVCRTASDGVWDIDTWVMSCRVLGRRVEESILARIAQEARRRGIARLTASFLPTARNAPVREHYDRLGFTLLAEDRAGARSYALETANYSAPVLPFRER